jgi:N-acetylneuraminic acid mutarotase
MIDSRYAFSITIKNGFIYVLGGRDYGEDSVSIMNRCERYSLQSNSWQAISPMNFKRCSSMSMVQNDVLYVAGGYQGDSKRLSNFECYNEQMNKWEIMGIELLEPLEASACVSYS